MEIGKFYFINDEFYERFKDCGLLENKEVTDGISHGRPCCYMFRYENSNLYWMIPISSKVQKYEAEYAKSYNKYGRCDNISFGYILGEKRAFLIQNMFPVTEKYVDNLYIDKNTSLPIVIKKDIMSEINAKARKKIRFERIGKRLGLSNILKIEKCLLEELE